ncbi:MAG: carboxypeptidase-like regulatory domain-containing protein [Bacteroidetes bacterium]|nr:MAG: carboxypeptidase-like regulatory domain-containing protein [Bacteroidota bacterium]
MNVSSSLRLLFSFCFLLVHISVFSSGIRGSITNQNGEPVPFATVYIAEIHHGTTANFDGHYELPLGKGSYEVRFQYLGYQTQVLPLTVGEAFKEVNIVLEDQQYALPEVVVTASGEDPAYYIMRRAIGLSQYYLNQVSEYSCKVYLKGTGVLTKIPALMRRQMEREGVEQDRYFVSETISEINFSLPNNLDTRVLSTRSSGNDNQTSPMMFVSMSLYRDINGIISPLSRSAFQVYRFELAGAFMENGQQINRIKVIPRRDGPDLYSGYIYIKDGTWSLHSVDLKVEQSFFSIGIRQQYNPVAENVWMPVSHDFDIDVSIMGLELNYKYMASVSDYSITLNPDLNHQFYMERMKDGSDLFLLQGQRAGTLEREESQPEMAQRESQQPQTRRQQRIDQLMAKQDLTNREMRTLNRLIRRETKAATPRPPLEIREFSMEIDDSARVRTATYWNQNRPVPLTPQELESFDEKADSEDDDKEERKRSMVRKMVFGERYNLAENWQLRHNGFVSLSAWNFNTVDGFVVSQRLNLTHNAPGDRRFSAIGNASWAFSRERFNAHVTANYLYHPFQRANFSISTGRATTDFAGNHGIDPTINAFSSLFFKLNPLKIYEKDYIAATHRFDLLHGLVLHTAADYSVRRPLQNHSDFAISNPGDNEYTSNIPPIAGLEEIEMPGHKSFILEGKLSYTHRHYYMRRGQSKIMMHTNFPTLSLQYREGFKGVLESETRFRQLELGINQSFNVRLVGNFTYDITAGKFFNNEVLYAPDFKHFSTSHDFIIMDGNPVNRFRTLDLYRYNSSDEYVQGFFQYEHARILIKRLPVLSRTLMREKLFFNTLALPSEKPYFEIGYGVSQIFLVLNVEVVTGFRGSKHDYTGFRISLPVSAEGAQVRL